MAKQEEEDIRLGKNSVYKEFSIEGNEEAAMAAFKEQVNED